MNPIQEIGEVVDRHGKVFFVDSMSAFGGVTFDFEACNIDYLVSSPTSALRVSLVFLSALPGGLRWNKPSAGRAR